MEFKVVDIPVTAETHGFREIADALVQNIGKAIENPFDKLDSNAVRKSVRGILEKRGVLETSLFRSQLSPNRDTLIMWLISPTNEEVKTDGE
jgi:hypothetical protein